MTTQKDFTPLQLTKTANGNTAVQCSTLYNALGLAENQYLRWIEKNVINNPFGIEGEDYAPLSSHNVRISPEQSPLSIKNYELKPENTALTHPKGEISNRTTRQKRNRQRQKDFVLTLDFAKRLAMMTRTEIGEKVRRYFLDCEKRLNQIQTELFAELEAYRELESIREQRRILNAKARQCRQRIKTATETVQYIQLTFNF